MRASLILRAPLVLAVASAALSAEAIPFHVEASGIWSEYVNGTNAGIVMAVDSQIGGYTPLKTVLGTHAFLNGFAVLTLGSDDPFARLNLVLWFPEPPVATVPDTLTWTGTWEPNGESSLDGINSIPTGSGTAVLTVAGPEGFIQPHGTLVLDGDLHVVPEPASMAALGLGALGLLRRRKKA